MSTDGNDNPNQWRDSIISAMVKQRSLFEILQALQTVVVEVEISYGDFTEIYTVPTSKLQSYEDVRNFVKLVGTKYPSSGSIKLEYNGRIACLHPNAWVPLQDLLGARIHAQVAPYDLAVKVLFRVAPGTVAPFDIPDTPEERTPMAFGGEELRKWIRSTIATTLKAAVPPEMAALVDEYDGKEKIVCALGHWPNGSDMGLEEVLHDGASVWGKTVYCDVSWPTYKAPGSPAAEEDP